MCVVHGARKTLRRLLQTKRSGPLDARNIRGLTALHVACERGDATCADLLVTYGSDPGSVTPERGENAFHIAAGKGYDEVVKVLLAAPTSSIALRHTNSDHRTPFEQAVATGFFSAQLPLSRQENLAKLIPPTEPTAYNTSNNTNNNNHTALGGQYALTTIDHEQNRIIDAIGKLHDAWSIFPPPHAYIGVRTCEALIAGATSPHLTSFPGSCQCAECLEMSKAARAVVPIHATAHRNVLTARVQLRALGDELCILRAHARETTEKHAGMIQQIQYRYAHVYPFHNGLFEEMLALLGTGAEAPSTISMSALTPMISSMASEELPALNSTIPAPCAVPASDLATEPTNGSMFSATVAFGRQGPVVALSQK